jgi:hypothetical protein
VSDEPRTAAGEPSEEELAAAFEEQLRQLTPMDVIVQALVSLINLAGRRLGLDPGAEDERDLEQARDGIDGARALMAVLERRLDAESLRPMREALSALQMHYVRLAGPPPGGSEAPPRQEQPPAAEDPSGPGPAQRSGRLWVPGQ